MVANQETIDIIKRYPDTPKKPISTIAFYQILANPFYQRQFNYFTVALPNREDFIIDDDSDEENDCEQSDMVSIMLNLAYLKQDYAKNVTFKRGFSSNAGRKSMKFKSFSASFAELPSSGSSSKSDTESNDCSEKEQVTNDKGKEKSD